MFLKIWLVILFANNSYAIVATNRFPYAQFFNISETKVKHFSKYACGIKQAEEKCCQCDFSIMMGDICVDQMWDPKIHSVLKEYLNESYFKSTFEHLDFETTCQPILNHVPLTSGHFVEHIEVVSYRFHDFSNVTFCNSYKKMQLQRKFNFIPSTHQMGFYYDKDCLDTLEPDVPILRYVPIKVYCGKAFNITLNMEFSVESINHLEKCIFVVDIFNDTYLEKVLKMYRCVHQKGFCERGNPFYRLCQSYNAPIRGYKNIHCALCDNQTWNHYEEVEQCTGCPNGLCDLRKKVDKINHPISFSLIPDEEGTEYRVENITSTFPIKEFFGVPSEIARQFKAFLCNQSKDSCCNCDKNCMRYHTCCIDALWNTTLPLRVKEYRELFIRKASEYKSHDCVPLIPLVQEKSKTYLMISKCFSRFRTSPWNEDETKRCLHPDSSRIKSIIPVIGADGYLYRNMYCAHCNDVYTYIPTNLTCVHRFSDHFDVKNCEFEIYLTKSAEYSNIVYKCNRNFENIISCDPKNVNFALCNAYKGNIGIYRNYHCYLCQHSKGNVSAMQKCNQQDEIDYIFPGRMTFVTFDATTFRVSSIKPFKKHMCETDNIFDLFGNGCRKRKIRLLSDYDFDRCVKRDGIPLFAKKTIQSQSEKKTRPQWMSFLDFYLDYTIDEYMSNHYQTIYRIIVNATISIKDFISYYVDSFKKSIELEEISYFYLSPTKEPIINKKFNLDLDDNIFPNNRTCYKFKRLDRSDLAFSNSCQITYQNNTKYDTSEVSMWIRFDRFTVSRFTTICEQFYMDSNSCSLKTIKNTNLSVDGNRIISYKEDGVMVQKTVGEYAPVMEGVVVCASKGSDNNPLWIDIIDKYTLIVSFMGSGVNLIFYVKIIYALYPSISLRPHLFLTSSLFLFEVSSLSSKALNELLSEEQFVFCSIVSVITHFAFLLVQTCCVMCCFDLLSGFAKNFPRLSRFRFHIKRSLSVALLITVTGFFIDYLGYASLGYNTNDKCISNEFDGQLYFFIIPMAVSIISSIIIFSSVISYILIEKQDINESGSKKEDVELVYLSLKIFMVVELIEIMGFIRDYDNNRKKIVFYSIFRLLNHLISGFRGVVMSNLYYNTRQMSNAQARTHCKIL